ncbi:MAG: cysteine desulfurase NifS [Dehalococcoidales bacterium]|jgi:cysteine desulfurase
MKSIYLDYAATTPVHPDALKAMLPYFRDIYGNPSSFHTAGQQAKGALEKARESVAGLIGARAEEIIFTSGGTEADNHALQGVCLANAHKGNHVITTSIEHHAVLETCKSLEKRGIKVTYLPVDRYGMVDPADVKKAITPRTILISVMHANNEIGTIQPVGEIGKIAREAGIYFHTDAVQTAGHIQVDVNNLGVDLLSMSAHKLYGPKGTGALFIRQGTQITPFIHGGGQEKGRRAGTENVPGIIGFGKAAEIARREMPAEGARLTGLRDIFIAGLHKSIGNIHLNGHPVQRLPNNINISVSYLEGESIILSLDLQGIYVSTGSACSSGDMEPSHVLLAAGCPPELARGSLRFTMGRWTEAEDIDRVLEVLLPIVEKLRDISPLGKK